jgi:hypothetical protein
LNAHSAIWRISFIIIHSIAVSLSRHNTAIWPYTNVHGIFLTTIQICTTISENLNAHSEAILGKGGLRGRGYLPPHFPFNQLLTLGLEERKDEH